MRFAYLLALFGEQGALVCREGNSTYIVTKVAEKIEWKIEELQIGNK